MREGPWIFIMSGFLFGAFMGSRPMKRINFVFALFAGTGAASAQEVVPMTIGQDTAAFHFELIGQTIFTVEAFEDHWWRYVDVLNAVYGPIFERTGRRFFLPYIREARGIENAFAVVFRNERFVIVDPSWWGATGTANTGEMLIYAHEIGHPFAGTPPVWCQTPPGKGN